MPIEETKIDGESGNTFGEGMDRTAVLMRRGDFVDGKPVISDDLHNSSLFRQSDKTDYTHQAGPDSFLGKIGSWFSHKGDEIKDSRIGSTVDKASSGLEARVKEEQARLQRHAEEASEHPNDSFSTTVGHKAEEAKQYGREVLQGMKADFRKEQVKQELGIPSSISSPLPPSSLPPSSLPHETTFNPDVVTSSFPVNTTTTLPTPIETPLYQQHSRLNLPDDSIAQTATPVIEQEHDRGMQSFYF